MMIILLYLEPYVTKERYRVKLSCCSQFQSLDFKVDSNSMAVIVIKQKKI